MRKMLPILIVLIILLSGCFNSKPSDERLAEMAISILEDDYEYPNNLNLRYSSGKLANVYELEPGVYSVSGRYYDDYNNGGYYEVILVVERGKLINYEWEVNPI